MPGKVEGLEVPGRVAFGPPGLASGRPATSPPGRGAGRVAGRVVGLVEGRVDGAGLDAGRVEAEGLEAGRGCWRWTLDPVAGLRLTELPPP